MNQILKSIFVGAYPLLALVGLLLAYQSFSHGFTIAALGLALTSLPIIIFFPRLFIAPIARTSQYLIPYSALAIIGILILIFAFVTGQANPSSAIGFPIFIGWLLYLFWYSSFKDRENDLLKIGMQLPQVNFEDENGQAFNTSHLLGKKNILLFYRGNWCPLCMAQIKELVADYKALENQGIQTVLISPQPHSLTKKLANKHNVAFKFLVDKGNAVARQLNIISENGLPMGFQVLGYDSDTVMPTIILTDEKGEIIHSDLTSNYRVRPEPAELMQYFK